MSIIVNEEDHLRMQSLMAGLRLRETYESVDSLDEELGAHLAFAYYAEEYNGLTPIGYRSASKQFNSMIYSTTAGGQWVLFGLLEAEELGGKHEVPGRGNRDEFGEPLDDSEENDGQ